MIKKHGGNVYKFAKENHIAVSEILDFSANINPLGLPKGVHEAFSDLESILNYPDPDYVDLVEAIARFENISSDYILVGNGGIECIFLVAEHLKLNRMLIPVPTFVEYDRAYSKYGQVEKVVIEEPFTLDVEKLITKLDSCDGIVICNPNNPTGHLVDRKDLLKLLETGKMIVVDEAFIDFTNDEARSSMVKYINDYDNLVITKSLTKFFAMPGLRLGYLMTSNKALLNDIKESRMPWSINAIAAKAGSLVLKDEDYISKTKSWIKEERQYMLKALRTLDIEVFNTEGNYIFLKSILELDKKLAKYGIMIRSCSNYDGLTAGYYRFAIKDREKNEVLLAALKEILWKS
ncbi:threonine-phosphate decarboxylase [Acidaminobacter sp. JC074]|uniref:threonine-phosphate decarboxylase CobD n=1 Tax=Acidaminobacter sp. JC074 TaxID=2530199 RepID=UPI001F0D915B|nr:threonine-phosphate decarboxylase CobD [Acidaminobacter sp. JC074]MCH4889159.1 threonine-phosphate decarboxylase [Acidaminobacter sp. JC074]